MTRVIFKDHWQMVEVGSRTEMFTSPKHARIPAFLQQVIH